MYKVTYNVLHLLMNFLVEFDSFCEEKLLRMMRRVHRKKNHLNMMSIEGDMLTWSWNQRLAKLGQHPWIKLVSLDLFFHIWTWLITYDLKMVSTQRILDDDLIEQENLLGEGMEINSWTFEAIDELNYQLLKIFLIKWGGEDLYLWWVDNEDHSWKF